MVVSRPNTQGRQEMPGQKINSLSKLERIYVKFGVGVSLSPMIIVSKENYTLCALCTMIEGYSIVDG